MSSRKALILGVGFALSFLSLCLANVLFLPPYEGFDETAHYSYISILADRFAIPNFRSTFIDAAVERDQAELPRPYTSHPPFEKNDGITYYEFFREETTAARRKAVERFWQEASPAAEYSPGSQRNWQGQHPPLYYLSMTPFYRIARTWPPGRRLLFLRICSVLLACGSLFFWWKSVWLFAAAEDRQFVLLSGLAASFFPSLFYDLARVGNDSLVAFLFAGSWYLLLAVGTGNQATAWSIIGLAIVLGLGLLTKLFFLPLLCGAVCCLFWFHWSRRLSPNAKPLSFSISILFILPVLIAGWWFWFFATRYGMTIGSAELYAFQFNPALTKPGFFSGQFFYNVYKGLAGFVTTFLWCGTWSWVRPSPILYCCFLPLFVIAGYGWLSFRWKDGKILRPHLLAAAGFFLAPLLFGFIYHIILRARFTEQGGGTGGYYLFFAWPVVGMLIASAFDLRRTVTAKICLLSSFLLVEFFELIGWWRSALVYSGILRKIGAVQTGVGFVWPTVENCELVLERLRMLCFPDIALGLYATALLLRSLLVFWVIVYWEPALLTEEDGISLVKNGNGKA